MGAAVDKSGAAVQKLTVSLEDLAPWANDNVYVLAGYRRELHSYWLCLRSCLYLHNETFNIWSHAIEAGLFTLLAALPFSPVVRTLLSAVMDSKLLIDPTSEALPSVSWKDTAVVYSFLSGAILLFSVSAAFHCFKAHSRRVCLVCSLADHMCIIVLTVASFIPGVYYGLYCRPDLQYMYLGMISVLGMATTVTVIDPKYRRSEYRKIKARMYLFTGLSGLLTTFHCIQIDGYENAKSSIGLSYLLLETALYIFGAVMYAERLPERLFPSSFDYFNSHGVFHLAVNAAAISPYYSIATAFQHRHVHGRMCT